MSPIHCVTLWLKFSLLSVHYIQMYRPKQDIKVNGTAHSLFQVELYLKWKHVHVEGSLFDTNNLFYQLIQLTPDWKS